MRNRATFAATLSVLASCLFFSLAFGAPKPNFIVILADDLGYGDLGCFGNPVIHTPSLDKMAAEGVKLTEFYVAACVCTPSRAALLTGRLPLRSGMAGSDKLRVLYHDSPKGLPPGEITIAKALKGAGYATGCIGKWHLGMQSPYLPTEHGFDLFFGLPYSNDMNRAPSGRKVDTASPEARMEDFNVPLLRGTNIVEVPARQDTLTRRYTEEAVKFIHDNRKNPFFLYIPHTFPHVPLFASEKFNGKSRRGLYGDVVEELDWSVGQVLQALKKLELEKNTFVLFTSDNGPWITRNLAGGSAGLLRDGKGSTWEGGMRVPALAWWPGKIQPGTVYRQLCSSMDLFPTLLGWAGVKMPQDRVYDGYDIRETLLSGVKSPREVFFYYRENELYAVRKGDFKIHLKTRPGYSKEPAEAHDPPLLFNLAHDPSERFNIADKNPRIVSDLAEVARKHSGEMKPGEPQY